MDTVLPLNAVLFPRVEPPDERLFLPGSEAEDDHDRRDEHLRTNDRDGAGRHALREGEPRGEGHSIAEYIDDAHRDGASVPDRGASPDEGNANSPTVMIAR